MTATKPADISLLVCAQPDETRRLLDGLRATGLAVRGASCTIPEQIAPLAKRQGCDLILCCTDDPTVDLEAVLTECRERLDAVPLILVGTRNGTPLTWALGQGARDLCDRDDPLHLRLAIDRELRDLRTRQQVQDLTKRLRQYEDLSETADAVAETAVALIQDGMHAAADAAYLRLFGFQAESEVHAAALLDLIEPGEQAAVRDFLRDRQSASGATTAELPVRCVRTDGEHFQATLTADPDLVDDEPCLRLTVRAIRPPRPTPAAAPAAPQSDEPSRLPDYAALIAAIGRETARPFALFYIAVSTSPDLFRDLGLSQGLEAIGTAAAALGELCGPLGMLAHLNVDGFGLLVTDLDVAGAELLAERIRDEVRLPEQATRTGCIEAHCHVGYILNSGTGDETGDRQPGDLLDAAYRACHGAAAVPIKPATPQKVTSLAARAKQPAETGDETMADTLARALEEDRFLIVFQPIVPLIGEDHDNYAVLLRLRNPDDSLTEAREFIGSAIRAGLIERLDHWMLDHALQALGEHRHTGHPINFLIHLAEDSLRNPDLLTWVQDGLHSYDVPGSWLTFAIQEDLFIGSPATLTRLVAGLKKMDCRIAINYFSGSGQPETLLARLKPDFVLLLPDLAKNLVNDKAKQERLLQLAGLVRGCHAKTVVTGVEDAQSMTVLWTAGVDYVQGNFLQRPSPTLDLAA